MSTANLGKVKLCQFLGMLGSNGDGEVLNAAKMVARQQNAMGLSWYQLLGIDEKGNDLPFTPDKKVPPKEDIWARAEKMRQEKAQAKARKDAWAHDRAQEAPRADARRPNSKPASKARFDGPYRSWDGVKDTLDNMIPFCESELAWTLSNEGRADDKDFLSNVRVRWFEHKRPLSPAQFKRLGGLHQWCREQLAAQQRSA